MGWSKKLENADATHVQSRSTLAKAKKTKALGYKPLDMAVAAGTHASSGGDGDIAHAARRNNGRENQDSLPW